MNPSAAAPDLTTAPACAPPTLAATRVQSDLVRLSVLRVGLSELAEQQGAWFDLCRRVVEPNVFLDPDFALPLLQHAPNAAFAFLMVWADDRDGFRQLVGLFPIAGRRTFGGMGRGYAHPQIACGTPLVDAGRADEVIDHVLGWLGRGRSAGCAIELSAVPRDGAFRAVLDRVCVRTSRRVVELLDYERAALLRGAEPSKVLPFASSKRRKEYARQVRRLSEIGTRSYKSARTPSGIGLAVERFLELEAAGWKGVRGTAFSANPALAGFVREMVQRMAAKGCCRIDALEIDGRPVAMGILLRAGDRDFFWKTAFDETHAALSPGVQFAAELEAVQRADRSIALTDSCAIAGHPMIDRVWSDRLAFADVAIAVCPNDERRFERALRWERMRRTARDRAKALWLGQRRRAR